MITSYEIALYAFSVFLIIFGIIFALSARDIPSRETKGIRQVTSPKAFFVFLTLVYFSLAHFNIYAVLIMNTDYGSLDCGERVANITTDGTNYFMNYRNTCSTTVPEVNIQIINIYTYLLWFNILMANIGLLAFIFKKMKNW